MFIPNHSISKTMRKESPMAGARTRVEPANGFRLTADRWCGWSVQSLWTRLHQ